MSPRSLLLRAFLARAAPAVLGLALLAPAGPASARELHWKSVDVRARLDENGALHVSERQAFVFDGDWNGGERLFRVDPGQKLAFETLTRITPDGEAHRLVAGDLSGVDEFAWKDATTLRWRSRLPSDPPFSGTEIVYELVYTLSGILQREAGEYVLDHDFLFPDRQGSVDSFTLELTLDPVWRPGSPLQERYERKNVRPGEGFVLRVPLAFTGAHAPSAGRTVAGRGMRLAALVLLALGTFVFWLIFRRRERALGRFEPLPSREAIDARWLQANVFSLLPEEAGALWDDRVSAPEVAAVIARLAAEGKLESHADGKKLTLKLRVSIDRFSGYERALLSALFFSGRTETDTDAIRSHYKSSGFDPASKIRPDLEERLKRYPEFQDRAPVAGGWLVAALFLAGVAVFVGSAVFGGEKPGDLIGLSLSYLFFWGAGAACAYAYRRGVWHGELWTLVFLWAPALFLWATWRAWQLGATTTPWLLAGGLLLRLAVVASILRIAATRDGPRRVARRKSLAAARRYFRGELAKSAPNLKDDWFPYVLAFGLTGAADRWFRAHGASGTAFAAASSSSSGGSSSSSGSGSAAWTGGGGAFGGGGASASWAVAAGALASGVAAPSSGGSGGGGGGGGGSSGGGGGGGW